MKIRLTAVAVIEVDSNEDLDGLSQDDLLDQIASATDIYLALEKEHGDSDCVFCGEPATEDYPVCEDCQEHLATDQ